MYNDVDSDTRDKLVLLAKRYSRWRPFMSEWEREFCVDCNVRYRTYGPFMKMSSKQVHTLTEIIFKLDA